jgi:hypothetical protein
MQTIFPDIRNGPTAGEAKFTGFSSAEADEKGRLLYAYVVSHKPTLEEGTDVNP